MSGADLSSASFQQAMEEVRQRMPSVTMLAIEHALRDCGGNVETCVKALQKYTGDSSAGERKYLRHLSYPQGITLPEQQEIEKGMRNYSSSWGSAQFKRGYSTLPNYHNRLHNSPNSATLISHVPTQQNNLNIAEQNSGSVQAGYQLESSQPAHVNTGNAMAATLPRLQSVDEGTDQYDHQYPTNRLERLDLLRKAPSLDELVSAQRRQLDTLEKRIEMLNQQTDAFKTETDNKEMRLQYLQSRFPTVNKYKIEEQSSLVLTLEDDVAQVNESLMYLKKEVEGKWECAHCTFLNFPLFTECEVCHFKKDTVPLWRT